MPSQPTCIGHEVGGEKAELFILRSWIWFGRSEVFLTELTWRTYRYTTPTGQARTTKTTKTRHKERNTIPSISFNKSATKCPPTPRRSPLSRKCPKSLSPPLQPVMSAFTLRRTHPAVTPFHPIPSTLAHM